MKVLAAILVSVLAVGHAMPQPHEPCPLQQDLRELLGLIDTDAVAGVLWSHMDDPEMQEVFAFMFSQQFRELYLTVASQTEIEAFFLWMDAQCVDLRPFLNRMRDYLEMPLVPWNQVGQRSGGVAGFWAELREVLNLPLIHEFAQRKYAESPDFAALIENLKSPEANGLWQRVKANEDFQEVVGQLETYGIDIQLIRDTLQSLLGW